MKRALLSLGLVLAVGCTPTVIVQPQPTTGATGGTIGGTSGGTNGGGDGGSTNGTNGGGGGDGGSTAGTTGGTTAGTTAGTTGGTTAGTTAGTTGGTTAGTTAGTTGGTTAGTTAGTTGGTSGGTTAGTTGGTTAGTTGGTSGGHMVPVQVQGTYDVTDQYDLVDALPPDVQEAVDMALDFAMSPGQFLLDMADKIPVVKYVVDIIKLFPSIDMTITKAIDERINGWSGGMVTVMKGISNDINMAIHGLKAHHTLVVSTPDASGNLTVGDTLVDLTFTYAGEDHVYPQRAVASTTGHVMGLQLFIDAHTYDHGLNFGSILVDLIDNVALPQLTGVNSVGALLNQLVDCGGLASWVWSYIANWCIPETDTCVARFMHPDDLTKLCVNALDAVGNALERKLAALDAPGMMSMSAGQCLAVENMGTTGHADTLKNGVWSLTLPIGSANITLPGTFTGTVPHHS